MRARALLPVRALEFVVHAGAPRCPRLQFPGHGLVERVAAVFAYFLQRLELTDEADVPAFLRVDVPSHFDVANAGDVGRERLDAVLELLEDRLPGGFVDVFPQLEHYDVSVHGVAFLLFEAGNAAAGGRMSASVVPAFLNYSVSLRKITNLERITFAFLLIILLAGCSKPKKQVVNGAFADPEPEGAAYDLESLRESGELIVATLSGPDSYFDYQGRPMGKQYALAEDFARSEGLRLRVEVARDEEELDRMLSSGDVDLLAFQLPGKWLKGKGLLAAGARVDSAATSWAVRKESVELAEALDRWFGEGIEAAVAEQENTRMRERRQVRRKVRAPYISKEKGIISTYDHLFKEAARHTGWDWRLIAAQCYQESGFDPNAVSWAGAKGLMQIMPGTAEHLGLPLEKVYSPADNVAAAAKLIRELSGKFSDIRDPGQRVRFVLAAYNGGYWHIRDAMALARKYGKRPDRWEDVAAYVLGLSQAKYYRDPVVKYGYMIGAETENYVASVVSRWQAYGGAAGPGHGIPAMPPADRRGRQNRFTKGTKILTPEELDFSWQEE